MGGKWYGPQVWFGLHYDLHAGAGDTDLGAHDDPHELAAALSLMNPQWVQTDCKGGPGLTSWFSKVPNASVAPGLVGDALRTWRAATDLLGVPLHAHYMSLWDQAAWDKHPEWRAELKLVDQENTKRLCPRSGYIDELVIPQMLEAVERYGVDGFWVDGESWAFQFCYCERCTAAYKQATGKEPSTDANDPDWPAWVNFQRDSVIAFTNHYIEAVRARYPEVLFTCDYSNTLRDPGEPIVNTDWLSADVWRDLDDVRQEARFMSTRGKPWDVMIWAFDRHPSGQYEPNPNPYNWRTLEEMERQGVQVICQGGNFQVYENPASLRDARLVPWRMQVLGQLGEFLAPRRALVQDTEPFHQVAVLDSEYHLRSQPVKDLFSFDIAPLRGALYNLLDQSYCTDILDEWALTPDIDDYQLVVVPEQERLSDQMVETLKRYVQYGGRLILSGAGMLERFGSDFLGVEAKGEVRDHVYFLPARGQTLAVWSARWRHIAPTTSRMLAQLMTSPLVDDRVLPYAAAVVHGYGSGKVGYIPGDVFRMYDKERRPLLRAFISDLIAALNPPFTVRADAPASVDAVLRATEDELQVHLLNKAEQPSGPIKVTIQCAEPSTVELMFEDAPFDWDWQNGVLDATIGSVTLHSAMVIELQEDDSCGCGGDCEICNEANQP
ncbi:MAG: hypothetical protein LLG44_06775 [Chloroflexi bacterium]|nr:hypothetical protein [Chloroflexota bacterium]